MCVCLYVYVCECKCVLMVGWLVGGWVCVAEMMHAGMCVCVCSSLSWRCGRLDVRIRECVCACVCAC